MNRMKWDEIDIEILRNRAVYSTVNELAEMYGKNSSWIFRVLKKHNIKHIKEPCGIKNTWSEDEVKRMLELRNKRGLSFGQIAFKLGKKQNAVHYKYHKTNQSHFNSVSGRHIHS